MRGFYKKLQTTCWEESSATDCIVGQAQDTTEEVEAREQEKEAWEKAVKVARECEGYYYLYLCFSISWFNISCLNCDLSLALNSPW